MPTACRSRARDFCRSSCLRRACSAICCWSSAAYCRFRSCSRLRRFWSELWMSRRPPFGRGRCSSSNTNPGDVVSSVTGPGRPWACGSLFGPAPSACACASRSCCAARYSLYSSCRSRARRSRDSCWDSGEGPQSDASEGVTGPPGWGYTGGRPPPTEGPGATPPPPRPCAKNASRSARSISTLGTVPSAGPRGDRGGGAWGRGRRSFGEGVRDARATTLFAHGVDGAFERRCARGVRPFARAGVPRPRISNRATARGQRL